MVEGVTQGEAETEAERVQGLAKRVARESMSR